MTRDIDPKYARELFLEAKRGAVKDSSLKSYKYPTRHFVEFLQEATIDSMANVDGFHLEQWRLSRKRNDIADLTLRSNCKHTRHFLNWCEDKEIVTTGWLTSSQSPTWRNPTWFPAGRCRSPRPKRFWTISTPTSTRR